MRSKTYRPTKAWSSHVYAIIALIIVVGGAVFASLLSFLDAAQLAALVPPVGCIAGSGCEANKSWWVDTLPQWLMVVLTFVASAAALIALFFVRGTLIAQREANAISERASRIQTRAYVHVSKVEIRDLHTEFAVSVMVHFFNSGSTPALRARNTLFTTITFVEKPPKSRELESTDKDNGTPLAPGQSRTTVTLLSSLTGKMVEKQIGKIYLQGVIQYDDIWGVPHRTDYSGHFHFDPDGPTDTDLFIFSNEGNDAD